MKVLNLYQLAKKKMESTVRRIHGKKEDPYLAFRFRVDIEGISSKIGFSKISKLSYGDISTYTYQEGNDWYSPRILAGPIEYPEIVLERGLTSNNALFIWRYKTVNSLSNVGNPGLKDDIKRNINIFILDRNVNRVVKAVHLKKAWPTALQIGDFDAMTSNFLVETIKLVTEKIEEIDII